MISIITINFNNAIGLRKTIESVVSQSFKNFEYIVIDGNSTDGSKDVLSKFKDKITYSISEPDSGVYIAMNKGVKIAKRDYLLFLNSGDVLVDSEVLVKIVTELKSGLDIYYGNLIFKDKVEKLTVYPDKLSFHFFYEKSLPHPASFIKRDLFDTISYYNEDLKIVSDWEFFIKAICKYNASYKHINETISIFETDGMSSLKENRKIIKEERSFVINKHFPMFIDDLKKTIEFQKIYNLNRVQMLLKLENSKMAKKFNSFWLNVLLKIFDNKKK